MFVCQYLQWVLTHFINKLLNRELLQQLQRILNVYLLYIWSNLINLPIDKERKLSQAKEELSISHTTEQLYGLSTTEVDNTSSEELDKLRSVTGMSAMKMS